MKVSEILELLKNRNPEDEIALAFWNVEDIVEINKMMADDENNLTEEETLSDEECLQVLRNIERYHDSEQGINYDVIKCHIDMVKERRS